MSLFDMLLMLLLHCFVLCKEPAAGVVSMLCLIFKFEKLIMSLLHICCIRRRCTVYEL